MGKEQPGVTGSLTSFWGPQDLPQLPGPSLQVLTPSCASLLISETIDRQRGRGCECLHLRETLKGILLGKEWIAILFKMDHFFPNECEAFKKVVWSPHAVF